MSVKNVANAEHYNWGVGCEGWRLLNGSDLAVIQERIPPGRGEVRHYHARSRQLFYVLRGKLEIEINDETHLLGEGDSLEILPTLPHCVRNPSKGDADFLVVSAPSTIGDRVNLESAPNTSV
jgi:mannose-6-phosphate isomerase-like protein (cupin superfamily)